MNWIRENKFLTGFIAVLVIGAGVLGYLLYTAYDSYADVSDQYTQASTDLKQLQSQVPYPDSANLAKYRAEHDDLVDATHKLATDLSQMELPVVNMTPSAFQDDLRDTLSSIKARAEKKGVKLSGKADNNDFTMDFAQYETQPPPAAAAGPLGRQLKALEIVMDILIDEQVDVITGIARSRLPQESATAAGQGHPGGGSRRQEEGGAELVDKEPFEIRFQANQPSFQKVINDLAASTKQFFIVRTLLIDNTNPAPVSKSADSGAPAGAAAPATAAPAPGSLDMSGTDNYLKFIVGTEEMIVTMRIDIVGFNPPDKSIRAGGAH
jgi:hypothetical protein